MNNYIYADNAATTQLDCDAFEAMRPYMLEVYGNPSQPYSFSRTSKKAIKEAREIIANCIGAEPQEIYFTSGGTESNNWAINSIKDIKSLPKCVLISEIEHHAIIKPCDKLKKEGVSVLTIKPDKNGLISPETLNQILSKNQTGLVSIMMANNEIGTIEPIIDLCKISHKYNSIFHTDAVQAIGHIDINVKNLGIDMMSASAHKFNGPKGIGFLYLNKEITISAFMNGGSQENNLRAGTENVASIVGMAYALKTNCDNLIKNQNHLIGLEERFISALNASGIKFTINGSNKKLPGLLSLSFNGQDGESILHRLDLMKIAISTGSACDSQRTKISHVLQNIGLDEKLAKGTIRISFGKNNTQSDVDNIVDALIKTIKQ